MKAVLRTLLATATTLFGLLFVTFLISRMLPADPVLAVVGDHASQALVDRTRIELGLDKPLLVQFGLYIGNVLQGDLGQSVRTGEPIASELARVFPATLELATLGTLIGVLAGVPLGILAALRKDTLIDHLVRFIGLMGYSFPIFWLGLMGLLVFYATLDVLPGPGRLDFGYEDFVTPITGLMTIDTLLAGDMDLFRNALAHLILPAGLLGYYSLAYISRMTRSLMLGELRQEYIITARVKGVSETKIVWKHALGNIKVPLITVVALSYAGLLEGSVLTETVFSWRGLGLYITDSIFGQDMPAVMGGTIVVGVIFIVINMLTDVAYRFLDPRSR
ncbi:peptide ABC transporter permease [Rhodospirillum rubrum]|uniref:ABC transporter permease n=1 Tax=Rhodospirillum rubrum TaxID=1085 RepID=UPI001906C7E6|nr:ABC transporter permease [Rhodospirillum rubrum]MBK1663658.1 peptide ABC transporter permease [Rhodospirillum rubrum]MBK1675976.1 peptide ABC transporter permease [Rhodospirillum rubrum]